MTDHGEFAFKTTGNSLYELREKTGLIFVNVKNSKRTDNMDTFIVICLAREHFIYPLEPHKIKALLVTKEALGKSVIGISAGRYERYRQEGKTEITREEFYEESYFISTPINALYKLM